MPSCSTGTSRTAKQNERVKEGLDAAYNPFWQLLDPSEIGLAGHSYGAAGVSSIAQWDPRVKAVVAWDNLGGPSPSSQNLDFSWIPNQAFGASLRGPDLIDWYTTAWFDKYLKHDPSADARLLSQRWRDDSDEAAVDPTDDGNAFSLYYYSRLDFHLAGGGVFDCEDVRDGCAGMVPATADGYPGDYSYVKIDTTPDSVSGPGAGLRPSSSLTACNAKQRISVGLKRLSHQRKLAKRITRTVRGCG